jgi:hypothetical protein
VSDNAVAIIGVLIPIVAIVMGLGIGMLKLSLDYRKKREILRTPCRTHGGDRKRHRTAAAAAAVLWHRDQLAAA